MLVTHWPGKQYYPHLTDEEKEVERQWVYQVAEIGTGPRSAWLLSVPTLSLYPVYKELKDLCVLGMAVCVHVHVCVCERERECVRVCLYNEEGRSESNNCLTHLHGKEKRAIGSVLLCFSRKEERDKIHNCLAVGCFMVAKSPLWGCLLTCKKQVGW